MSGGRAVVAVVDALGALRAVLEPVVLRRRPAALARASARLGVGGGRCRRPARRRRLLALRALTSSWSAERKRSSVGAVLLGRRQRLQRLELAAGDLKLLGRLELGVAARRARCRGWRGPRSPRAQIASACLMKADLRERRGAPGSARAARALHRVDGRRVVAAAARPPRAPSRRRDPCKREVCGPAPHAGQGSKLVGEPRVATRLRAGARSRPQRLGSCGACPCADAHYGRRSSGLGCGNSGTGARGSRGGCRVPSPLTWCSCHVERLSPPLADPALARIGSPSARPQISRILRWPRLRRRPGDQQLARAASPSRSRDDVPALHRLRPKRREVEAEPRPCIRALESPASYGALNLGPVVSAREPLVGGQRRADARDMPPSPSIPSRALAISRWRQALLDQSSLDHAARSDAAVGRFGPVATCQRHPTNVCSHQRTGRNAW